MTTFLAKTKHPINVSQFKFVEPILSAFTITIRGYLEKEIVLKEAKTTISTAWTNNTGYIQKEEKPAVYSEIFSEVQATEILLTVGRT